jgi:hypothetical protein
MRACASIFIAVTNNPAGLFAGIGRLKQLKQMKQPAPAGKCDARPA